MIKRRVCIYGGTTHPEPAPAFVTEMTRLLLENSSSVIVTGGFLHFADDHRAVSTDHAAL
jgi:hypothetical protein